MDEIRQENVDVLFLVWMLSRSTHDLLDTVLAPAGLTGDEFALYSVLGAAEHITPSELARWMAAPPTTVSSYLRRLEARGHVAREPNPEDRRSHRIRITPAGRRAHEAAGLLFRPVRAEVIDALADQERTVHETLLLLRGIIDDIRGRVTTATDNL